MGQKELNNENKMTDSLQIENDIKNYFYLKRRNSQVIS